ncbi:hypothetical protein [Chelatococcus reniformis]|uniref:Outer membrane protein beta-barrel domain-containing protein n=1 Tax=Chelatococcus reniformis TaxID=1494448 RepID=A0A916TXD4_9HYPH|nr:hypothetical protein [Chelatococcus reniformis]GGC49366.1 hypothetical protein GCM10010994_05650 [Chelatococcus reniformis]
MDNQSMTARFLRRALAAAGCAMLAWTVQPVAATAADLSWAAEPAPAPLMPEWRFQLTGYGWATSMTGDVGVKHLPPAQVDVPFSKILKHLDGGLMGSFRATNGTWTVMTDTVWAKLSDKTVINAGGGTGVELGMRQLIASALVGYRLPIGAPDLELSLTAGVRYQRLTVTTKIQPGFLPLSIDRSSVKQWADPVFGLLAHYRINDRWFVNALGDVGGFGAGSRLTAQGFGSVGYMWTAKLSTALGYRAIYTDYKDGGFVYKVTEHGPFMSVAYHF